MMVTRKGFCSELPGAVYPVPNMLMLTFRPLVVLLILYTLAGWPIPNPWLSMTCQSILSMLISLLLSSWPLYLTGPIDISHRPVKLTGSKTELITSLPPLNHSSPWSPYRGEWHESLSSFPRILFTHPPHHYSLNLNEPQIDFIPRSWLSYILNGS